jgi:hypothetical protein
LGTVCFFAVFQLVIPANGASAWGGEKSLMRNEKKCPQDLILWALGRGRDLQIRPITFRVCAGAAPAAEVRPDALHEPSAPVAASGLHEPSALDEVPARREPSVQGVRPALD